ncbi:MAG: FAD-dependent oxidoreductase, partial [Blautia sp.]|nr:FAD-dependent oxidoreductase [Blautia sp.]
MGNKISRKDFLLGSAIGAATLAFGQVPVFAEEEAASFNATSEEGLTNVDISSMKSLEADVAVIGGGGAGLSAAIAAAEAGKSVMLMEKIGFLGGTTMLSSGIIPATGTQEQIDFGVTDDSVGANARDILRPSNYSVRQELVYTVAEKAKDMVDWLRGMGVKWTLMNSLFYGQSEYRMHQAEGSGAGMTKVMIDYLGSFENVTSVVNTKV